jgi:hypothetical protein
MVRQGHRVELFDSYYFPDRSVLAGDYDFVTATEVIEHLHQPGRELARLWELLRPGGWLGIMTKLVRDPAAFAAWHYIRDPTHVCFFSRRSLRWWARRQHADLEFIGEDVILLRKPDGRRKDQSGADSSMSS